ncbi:Lrp/AsnC family transcriptional regulator [Arthrobacter sp.]|uniref:Lrp/AsnC family transcriptional regulator n=1 Tax=Arthrobacter sp. TaxID=1667 RepID=UPI001EB1E2D3|nr:Lrp/AsnC family transcriptional regulator [Micrococcaceae bacterium RIT 802]
MELPVEDLELVHALQISPRATWSDLGLALDRHPTTLAARWARLHGGGLVWVTGHLAGDPRQSCTALVRVSVTEHLRDGAVRGLQAIPEVATVEEVADDGALRLVVLTADWRHLASETLSRIREIAGVAGMDVVLSTRMYALGNNWRLDVLAAEQQRRLAGLRLAAEAHARNVPPLFGRMLPLLARNGRATAAELATDLGVHPSTAGRQLRAAVASGFLTFRCELAQDFSGYPIACHWFVRVPPADMEATVAFLRRHRTLRLCAAISGSANLTFHLWLRTPADIVELEEQLQAAVPTVTIIQSSVCVRTHKRLGWLLKPDSTCTGEVVPQVL